jgi:NDP-sugar pyrophosphorylase family protein
MMQYGLIRHVLIMAAGRGNRMRPLTDVIPKAMLPYRNGTLIGHSLEILRQNVHSIHVTVGYKGAMLSQYLMTLGNVMTIINTEGHDNSWWIYNTLLKHLDEPVLVLTCDNITELNLEFLNAEYTRIGAPACMIVPVVPILGIEGDYLTHEDEFVTTIQRDSPSDMYCSGIQVLNPARVVALTQYKGSFYSLWDQLVNQRQLKISRLYLNKWFSVDTLEQLAILS